MRVSETNQLELAEKGKKKKKKKGQLTEVLEKEGHIFSWRLAGSTMGNQPL